jgi:hypothetical protein
MIMLFFLFLKNDKELVLGKKYCKLRKKNQSLKRDDLSRKSLKQNYILSNMN